MPEYADRDASSLEPHYSRHVSAMTTEGLHAKSDIAAELAWRDKRIAELEAERTKLAEAWFPYAQPDTWTRSREALPDELLDLLDDIALEGGNRG